MVKGAVSNLSTKADFSYQHFPGRRASSDLNYLSNYKSAHNYREDMSGTWCGGLSLRKVFLMLGLRQGDRCPKDCCD